ncbi:hypothetical protein ACQ4PT_045066 [Festuca glaucescens]
MAVYASLGMNLDFLPGISFRREVRDKFNSSVHPVTDSGRFLLVVSFGRARFRLDETSVAVALESCLGGLCGNLEVLHIRDRVFRFSVRSKRVGFHVTSTRSYSCKEFKCFFHLWGSGGPNWEREFRTWCSDQEKEWTLVSPLSKQRARRALEVMDQARQKGTKPILKRSGASRGNRRLLVADPLVYPACVGYSNPAAKTCRSPELQPQPRFGSFDRSSEPVEMTVHDINSSLIASEPMHPAPRAPHACKWPMTWSWTITAYPLIGDVQPAHMPPTEDLKICRQITLMHTPSKVQFSQNTLLMQHGMLFGGGHTSVVVSPQAVDHNQGIFLKTPEESSSEWSEPLDLAEAAKDLKLAGYTEVEILATLEEFKHSGKPYYPGSPPWMPKLPVNLFEAAKDLKSAGYSDGQIASFLEDFKKFGLPYVSGSPLWYLSNRADGYRLTTDVCSQKICKRIPMEARQNTLFKRSSPKLKMISSATLPERKDSDMAVIPIVSPLHRKPAPHLPVETLRALGTNFCGIPPEEIADELRHLIVPNEDVD